MWPDYFNNVSEDLYDRAMRAVRNKYVAESIRSGELSRHIRYINKKLASDQVSDAEKGAYANELRMFMTGDQVWDTLPTPEKVELIRLEIEAMTKN